MLQNIIIQQFQSHKASKLEFSPGVNVVVGSSDSGKTAILRALRWLVWNRPSGEEFRSHWAGEESTSVSIESTEKDIIYRVKDNSTNQYYLNDIEFNAFGTDVPKEISDVLNLNDTNIQRQLDAPFLLSDTPGEVAQHFNKIAHLDAIDSGLKKIQSWIRELENNIKFKNQDLETKTTELAKYDFLDKFESDVEVLEDLSTVLIAKVNNQRKLKAVVDSLQVIQEDLDTASQILVVEKPVNDLLILIKSKNELATKKYNLSRLLAQETEITTDLTMWQKVVEAEKPVKAVQELIEKRNTRQLEGVKLNDLLINIQRTDASIKRAEIRYNELHDKFESEIPNQCPLCNTILKK